MSVDEGDLVKWRENVMAKMEKNNTWNLDWQRGRSTGLVLKIWERGIGVNEDLGGRFGFAIQASVLWQDGSISETSTSCLEKLDVP